MGHAGQPQTLIRSDASNAAAAANFVVHGDKTDETYAPSHPLDGEFVNDAHRDALASVADIPGWLQPGDALKLYELAYFARGPILEIGTYRGKSTSIIAAALRDAGSGMPFFSLDIDPDALAFTRRVLRERNLGRYVHLVRGTTATLLRVRPDLMPVFTFVDGDHTTKGVLRDLAALHHHVPDGGVLLFHDYVDTRYGVANGVAGSWVADECEFSGRFGCAVLFRRTTSPTDAPTASAEPLVSDIIGLEDLALRARSRFVAPAFARIRYRELRDRLHRRV